METTKLRFEGKILEFVAVTFLFLFLSVCTFGLLFPFMLYWQIKYTINNTYIDIKEK